MHQQLAEVVGAIWARVDLLQCEVDEARGLAAEFERLARRCEAFLGEPRLEPPASPVERRRARPAGSSARKARKGAQKRSTRRRKQLSAAVETRILRQLAEQRPDLLQRVREGTLAISTANDYRRKQLAAGGRQPGERLESTTPTQAPCLSRVRTDPSLCEWPGEVQQLQDELAQVTDALEVAGEDELEALAARSHELVAELEAAKQAAMNAAG